MSTPVELEVSEASLGPGRHEARERAIGLLYEGELRELAASDLLDELPLRPNEYAVQAVVGVEAECPAIDELITEHANGWSVERLPSVDRAILRLAIWELRNQLDVPVAVVIDEAVELAKEYSTEQSSGFVNGVLDSIASALRPA